MKLLLLAVGRMKAGPERELLRRYIDRTGASARAVGLRAVQTIEIDESRARSGDLRKLEEAAAIRDRIPAAAAVVLLDERGESLNSDGFAALIARTRDAGTSTLAFCIGGADGLDPGWRDANRTIAFGAITFPHQLVRVLLAEQLYRAVTILAGHPYHRT